KGLQNLHSPVQIWAAPPDSRMRQRSGVFSARICQREKLLLQNNGFCRMMIKSAKGHWLRKRMYCCCSCAGQPDQSVKMAAIRRGYLSAVAECLLIYPPVCLPRNV
ncbi:MAG: hypothetical protein ACI3V2_01215, partial [Faecousia sp.]